MKIYSKAGDIPFRRFRFPDGQPHVEIQGNTEFGTVTIEVAIRNSEELLEVLLARDALRAMGKATNLDIRYLMGARMDRAIGVGHPATLSVIAQTILAAGFNKIRILDPHSSIATLLLNATPVYPRRAIAHVLNQYDPDKLWIMAPDAGSTERVEAFLNRGNWAVLQGYKTRDTATGKLTGFGVRNCTALNNSEILIMDDICDGGGTFVGMSEVLRKLGAKRINLFVTHGIFSKGVPLTGIDTIWTTDSYLGTHGHPGMKVIPIRLQDEG